MSINAFKEALKPCRTNSVSSTSSSTQISQKFDSSIASRNPPKSSLSRQLLRLQDDAPFYAGTQPKSLKTEAEPNPGREVVEIGKFNENELPQDPKVDSFCHFDPTEPYEPLVLSPPGEIPVIQVPASINCRLLEYQREGVKFLYKLYRNNHGGILGDDMGLGKTVQTIAFLVAIYGKDLGSADLKSHKVNCAEKNDPVLIICPSSVIQNWENEFSNWSSFIVCVYHGPNRDLIIKKLGVRSCEILVTSFDTYRIHGSILSEIQWEIVVVDEAHRLKNEKSKIYTSCLKITTMKRYGLTGTIMQNKIMELFNLFDWAVPGCLGTREHFREFYDEPLKHGQSSSAPQRFVEVADERKQHLVLVLKKYMLRRTKEETIGHLMKGKVDNVVFCAMSELQRRVYQRTLQLPDIQCLINKDLPCDCGSPLKQFECCKRTIPDGLIWPYLHRDNVDGCDSCPFCLVLPCLVKLQQISNHLELIKPNTKDDEEKQRKDANFAAAVFGNDVNLVGGSSQNDSFMGLSDVKHCGKMRALKRLMHSWISKGDKVLLFSYSVRMLNILEKFIIRKGYTFSRLDGSTPTSSRQSLVDDFNSSPSKQVFLISTRAGGLGLNLVSANRVVIFDPNWNPAQDLQAQDRSFRFGQKRHVTVFRLLAAGSLEELIYLRQIYKQQLSNISVSGKMENRYFEGVQDCKEFQGELFGICNLFRDLSNKIFTSEIVDSHKMQGKECNQTYRTNLDLSELGISSYPPLKDMSSRHSVVDESNKETIADTVLENLGIVYAHRNEDIVNYRSRCFQEEEKPGIHPKETAEEPCSSSSLPKRKGIDEESTELVAEPPKRRKTDHCSLLAVLMGMEEVEVKKLLSDTPPLHHGSD